MDIDAGSTGWLRRATGRWVAYVVLWLLTVATCLFATIHPAFTVAAGFLGVLLGASLPLAAATLFEAAYSRRSTWDMPLVVCPWLGAATLLLGVVALLQMSPLAVGMASSTVMESARVLCDHFAREPVKALPRTVCIGGGAFVKTDWEAGKLLCEETNGHVECQPTFMAAPIFSDKAAADAGLPAEIWAWAVAHGRHVSVRYQDDGTLCGHLSGHSDLESYRRDYRIAIKQAIDAQSLSLPADVAAAVPLKDRPVVLMGHSNELNSWGQVWVMSALVCFCFCPCSGPVPLAAALMFLRFAALDRYDGRCAVDADDQDEELQAVLGP